MDDRGSILGDDTDYDLHPVQNGSSSYFVVNGGSLLGRNATAAWNWSLISHFMLRLKICEVFLPLTPYVFTVWCLRKGTTPSLNIRMMNHFTLTLKCSKKLFSFVYKQYPQLCSYCAKNYCEWSWIEMNALDMRFRTNTVQKAFTLRCITLQSNISFPLRPLLSLPWKALRIFPQYWHPFSQTRHLTNNIYR